MSRLVNISDLEKQAKLCLTVEEKNEISEYAEFLISDFEKLAEVDTAGVKPLIHGVELNNIFREDKAVNNIDREKLLENAPEQENGYFVVPKTID